MDDSISRIINDDIDIHETLGVSSTSTPQEIRRAYRQQALRFHPDKNPGSAATFNLILTSYEILTDPALKSRYDELRELKASRAASRDKLDELTRRFQDEVIASEKKKQETKKHQFDIESIREDGLKRRRLQEQALISSKGKSSMSIYGIPLRNNVSIVVPSDTPTVLLKYKYKKELKDLVDEDVISKIMAIFGNVTRVKLDGHDGRYAYAYVDFETLDGCRKALEHNYNESAKKWDGTDVRKLASLLRGCKKVDTTTSELTANEKVNQILRDFTEHVNSVSDKNAVVS
ncbi:Pre-mRNA-splicing factor cwf23 [Candida viswanathii]|uniref:Pre-mRNA-splicing factor cwf23 n=1 Tax=Candida viswanathii TaxID=5486 RepID=A0A367XQ74_9ASCO|nr:Pre-mRNA-splicing factor cwf23 [Candida viswanathii]